MRTAGADVGHGTIDWPKLMKALRADALPSISCMEHDNPTDFDRFAKRSIAAVKSM